MSRRAVVYLYTQTGQLREVAEAFTAPLEADGWRIRWVDVQPRVAFPFPWSIRQFFGVFPRAVDPDALVQLAEPPGGFGAEQDEEEVVVLAYQGGTCRLRCPSGRCWRRIPRPSGTAGSSR